jgi:uncharacterized protein YgbK (DUF1537 family)
MPERTPEQIRASIESNRMDLGRAVERLRDEVAEATDWRKHLRNNHQQAVIAAAGAGFVLGGGIGGVLGIFRRS